MQSHFQEVNDMDFILFSGDLESFFFGPRIFLFNKEENINRLKVVWCGPNIKLGDTYEFNLITKYMI